VPTPVRNIRANDHLGARGNSHWQTRECKRITLLGEETPPASTIHESGSTRENVGSPHWTISQLFRWTFGLEKQ
jgi:hypothetical protein